MNWPYFLHRRLPLSASSFAGAQNKSDEEIREEGEWVGAVSRSLSLVFSFRCACAASAPANHKHRHSSHQIPATRDTSA